MPNLAAGTEWVARGDSATPEVDLDVHPLPLPHLPPIQYGHTDAGLCIYLQQTILCVMLLGESKEDGVGLCNVPHHLWYYFFFCLCM